MRSRGEREGKKEGERGKVKEEERGRLLGEIFMCSVRIIKFLLI